MQLPLRNWRRSIQDKNISDVLTILGAPQRKLLLNNMDLFLTKVCLHTCDEFGAAQEGATSSEKVFKEASRGTKISSVAEETCSSMGDCLGNSAWKSKSNQLRAEGLR